MAKTIMVDPETGREWLVAPGDLKRFRAEGFVDKDAPPPPPAPEPVEEQPSEDAPPETEPAPKKRTRKAK